MVEGYVVSLSTRIWDSTLRPIDALVDINTLNDLGARQLPSPTPDALPEFYYDTNGDGFISPNDPLQKINFLNEPTDGSPEGESNSSGAAPIRAR